MLWAGLFCLTFTCFQPPRPVSTYVDPADRVAKAPVKAQADDIQTWVLSEVDKKGKKKKGTLGVGNGSVFFASESDKVRISSLTLTVVLCLYFAFRRILNINGVIFAHRHLFRNGKHRPSNLFA